MTDTFAPDTDENGYFAGDPYDRLRKSARIFADDPNVWSDDEFVTPEMLMAYIDELREQKVLDGLTEYDGNTVSMLVVLDFIYGGPTRMAKRVVEWLDGEQHGRNTDSTWGVAAALTAALKVILDAFAQNEVSE